MLQQLKKIFDMENQMLPGSAKIHVFFSFFQIISFSRKQIEESAKMSGAHDFIIKLQNVMNSLLYERVNKMLKKKLISRDIKRW